jgi:hypothetical protein
MDMRKEIVAMSIWDDFMCVWVGACLGLLGYACWFT